MLMERYKHEGKQRVIVRSAQELIIVERDGEVDGGGRLVSWSSGHGHSDDALKIGPSCARACPHAARDQRPVRVELTIDQGRTDVRWWAGVLSIMAERPRACSRCSLLTRWAGLHWCGVPLPVRWWKRMRGRLTRCTTCAVMAIDELRAGCGCCLNVKWRLLLTPGSMMREAWAAVVWLATGVVMETNSAEAACPYGLWPKAL